MLNEIDTRRLESFLQFVSACSRLRDYDPLLALLAQRSHLLFEFERFTLLLCDEHRQILRTIIIEDHKSREASAGEIQGSEMAPMRETLKTGTAKVSATEICTPLISAGSMNGVLYFTSSNGSYTPPDVQLVQFLADCLAGTFERLAQPRLLIDPAKDSGTAFNWHAESRRMSYLAQHDALTGLPNRWLLNERLTWALSSSSRYGRRLAVLFLDLDHFKEINDSLGHGIGDQVLRQIANRLLKCVRSSDTVSRIGGDEFVILLTEIESAKDATLCAEKIVATVTAPLSIGADELHPALSIGIGIYPGDGEDAETLIRNADIAMYHTKEKGHEKFQLFRKDMKVAAFERRQSKENWNQAGVQL